MAEQKFGKVKVSMPISIIVHGGNLLGYNLAKTVIEQGGRAIIVDQYGSRSKKYVSELKKLGVADFIDFNGLENLYKSLGRVDYVFYLLNERLHDQRNFTSKDFLEESNHLNATLKTAQKHDAKVALVTTMRLNQELSAHILNSNLSSPSPYSSIELQKYCETLTAEYRDKSSLNTRIIRLGALLGEGIEEIADSTIAAMLDESITKLTISIEGEGLDLHYLIHTNDAVYGILKLTFSDDTDGEVVSLANNQDYTTLSIAYKLLELNPDTTQIKFVPQTEKRALGLDNYSPAPNAVGFGWAQKIPLETAFLETISTIYPKTGKIISSLPKTRGEKRIENTEQADVVSIIKTPLGEGLDRMASPFIRISIRVGDRFERFKSNLSIRNVPLYLALLISTVILLNFLVFPIISIGIGGYLTYSNTNKAIENARSLRLEDASKNLESSNDYIKNVTTSFSKLKWAFDITNQQEFFNSTSQLLFGAQYATSGGAEMIRALSPLGEYIQDFEPAIDFQNNLPVTGREYRDLLIELRNNRADIQRGAYDVELASNLIRGIDTSAFPKNLQNQILQIKDINNELSEVIEPVHKMATFMPDLLGLDKRVRYMILLQNPSEIRATGGWLSSYALISIENGQIRELKVDDIYNADGQLRVQGKNFPAPTSMQEALNIDSWSLSLLNWNPDLATTTDAAQFFVRELDPGTTLDGVIAVDTEVLKKLLRKWDGIEVVGESELVTADNLDQKIYSIHTEFTPGSTTKATFLANLANETLKKLLSSESGMYGDVSDVFIESLNEKHLLVYLKQKDALSYLSLNRWAGLLDRSYLSAPATVEWNWGANKANAFLTKNHTLNIDIIDVKNLKYSYSLAIQNNSTTKIYPQGDYENYMRIYIPQGARILSTDGFNENEYLSYNENGFQVVGGWFSVPVGSTRVFKIEYSVNEDEISNGFPISISNDEVIMDLSQYKQPGTGSDNIKIDIAYPQEWAAVRHEGLIRGVNMLSIQTQLNTDKNFNIVWKFK